jgi:DNA processing protein
MISDQEKIYWLAWSKIKGLGPISLKRIYGYFGSLEKAWYSDSGEYIKIEGIGQKTASLINQEKAKVEPEQFFLQHQEKNPCFCTPHQSEYPQLLLEIPSPPAVLYYRGNLRLAQTQSANHLIGIVGTRKPTEHGKRWTYNISKALAQSGFTVVSGLAEGIDAIAHRGCLDGGGKTIAVLGNGLDRAYPRKNKQLMTEIAEKGLILTEYENGSLPEKGNFPARNRIVAGLCRAVLVMEAPEKSGALITARYANDFNRDVYTLPNSPDNFQARGCLRLIHKGAEIIITQEELLTSLGAIPSLAPSLSQQLSLFSPSPTETNQSPTTITNNNLEPIANIPNLAPPFSTVYNAIASEPTSLDMIVTKSGLTSSEVSSILLQLELDGVVSQLPGMMYQKN